MRNMIVDYYISRAKLKLNHIILSVKQKYDSGRGMIKVEAIKESGRDFHSVSAASDSLLACKLQKTGSLQCTLCVRNAVSIH